MSLTIFSPGDIIKSTEHNDNFNDGFKLHNEKAINDVSATNSGVLAGSSQVLIDKFLNATGQNNTVDTGTGTTSEYVSSISGYVCDHTYELSSEILEPGFETVTNWTYSENDPFSQFSGAQSTDYATQGTYSYRITHSRTNAQIYAGHYGEIYQMVNFDNIDYIQFDLTTTASGIYKHTAMVLIDGVEIYSRVIDEASRTTNDVIIPVVSYKGFKKLQFRLQVNTTIASNTGSANAYFDNLRTQRYTNSILKSKGIKNNGESDLSSTHITNGNFETGSGDSPTGWIYSETDPSGVISGAINTTNPISGTQDYKFSYSRAEGGEVNFSGQIVQTIDCTYLNKITFDVNKSASSGTGHQAAQIQYAIGSISGNIAIDTNAISIINKTLDCSTLTGNQTFTFRITSKGSGGPEGARAYTVQLDNIKVYGDIVSVPTGMTKVFVTPLMYEALSPGDSITADVSIDNGSTYTEDVPVNEWTPITSANGTQLIVKANLLPGDGSTTPKVSGWRVLLE